MMGSSTPCVFPWCLPNALTIELEDDRDGTTSAAGAAATARRKPSPLKVDSEGVLAVPKYRPIRREESKILQGCWAREWKEVIDRCRTHPEEASHITQFSRRTALHLATFNHPCPPFVAQALLSANRHMVLVQDAHRYTPLHNVALFPGESLVKLFCDTAIMVQQELQSKGIPPTSGTSPLFLAAKRAAPLRTLRTLLGTRTHYPAQWIAPSTGGEPYWMDTLDEYSSPLEILLRDRAPKLWLPTLIYPDGSKNTKLLKLMRESTLKRLVQQSTQKEPKSLSGVDDPILGPTTQAELDALNLWNKSLELLVEHIPHLQESKDDNDDTKGDTKYNQDTLPSKQKLHRNHGTALVHCIASAKVPLPVLLQVALMVFPEQALQYNEYGMLPLHHVLFARHKYTTQTLVSMLLQHSPETALMTCSCNTTTKTTNTAATTTTTPIHQHDDILPKTPLGIALDLQLPLGVVEELLMADSHVALSTIDPGTGLLPFATAAARGYSLDVIYVMLRAHPQVIRLVTYQSIKCNTSGVEE